MSFVISLTKKFIFIHVYKVAGMAIEEALTNDSNMLHIKCFPERDAVSFMKFHGLESSVETITALRHLHPHCSATEMIAAIGQENYEKFFKFCFVRNPWELHVSMYQYSIGNRDETIDTFEKHKENFRKYCFSLNKISDTRGSQSQFFCDVDGNVLVDKIGRYEYLEQDFYEICDFIGVKTILPHANSSFHQPWQLYYDQDTFDHIYEVERFDIEGLGYSSVTFMNG